MGAYPFISSHLRPHDVNPRESLVFLFHPFGCVEFRGLAERVGFEPSVDTKPTTVFETVPFNNSGTSPRKYQVSSVPVSSVT